MALQFKQPATRSASQPATGKPKTGAPITAHPLFPAVVALWFGALFGLGSLAIRVGLIEALVLASQIDSVIPAAAPPLGISARILLALVLAAFGAGLGATIARKIAAPKPETRERKRKALLGQEDAPTARRLDAHPDAPARKPISAHEELGEDLDDGFADAADQPSPTLLAGRRRSALAIEPDDTFELHEFAPLPGSVPQILSMPAGAAEPLELDSFAETGGAFSPHAAIAPGETVSNLDWSGAEPGGAAVDAASKSQTLHASPAKPGLDSLNFSPPADAVSGRQVFGMAAPQPDEVLDQLGIIDAEFTPLAPASAVVAVDPAILPMSDLARRLGESIQRRRDRTVQAAAATAAQAALEDSAADIAVPPITPAPLALTTVAGETSEPAVELHRDFISSPPQIVQDPEPTQPSIGFARLDAATPDREPEFNHPNQIPAFQAPLAAAASAWPDPAPAYTGLPDIAPLRFASVAPTESDRAPVVQAVDTAPTIPAALRPLSFNPVGDDDDEALPSFLPPRRFPGTPDSIAQPAAEDVNEPVPEDKFSSLLDLGRTTETRQSFVRIEDPQDEHPAAEPVVIFPGQVVRSAEPGPAADTGFGPRPGADASEASFRQFDSPTTADQGQAITGPAVVASDPAETERALRAALANLQRMSGAA